MGDKVVPFREGCAGQAPADPVQQCITELEELIVQIRAGEFHPKFGCFAYIAVDGSIWTSVIGEGKSFEIIGILASAQHLYMRDSLGN